MPDFQGFNNKYRDILDEFIENNGWDDETIINILCYYCHRSQTTIPNEYNFRDFLEKQVKEGFTENGYYKGAW